MFSSAVIFRISESEPHTDTGMQQAFGAWDGQSSVNAVSTPDLLGRIAYGEFPEREIIDYTLYSRHKVWEAASQTGGGKVDIVLFTVGGKASFSMSRGFVLNPPNLCTHALLNLLSTIPDSLRAPETQPRFVMLTSMGIMSESHATVPLALKPLYGGILPAMHADKLGMEHVLVHSGGLPWSSKDHPGKDVLPQGWQSTLGLPGQGELKHVVVIRPALLTDGECRGDEARKAGKAPYRMKKDGDMSSAWRVLRQDVAHFVVHELLPNWYHWEGSGVVLAY